MSDRLGRFPNWIHCSPGRTRTVRALAEVLASIPADALDRLAACAFVYAPAKTDYQREWPEVLDASTGATKFIFLPPQMDGGGWPHGSQRFADNLIAKAFSEALAADRDAAVRLCASWGFNLPGNRRRVTK